MLPHSQPSPPPATTTGPIFLKKLHDMMEKIPIEIGGWNHDGTSIEIKNLNEFTSLILPKYFRHGKITSFYRQLQFYGFQKINENKPIQFQHIQFQRNQPKLILKMKRKINHSNDEFYQLRGQVDRIRNQVVALNHQVHYLTKVVSVIMEEKKLIVEQIRL